MPTIMTLAEYLHVPKLRLPKSYFDLLCDDVFWYLSRNFLSTRDVLLLRLSRMEEGREPTVQEEQDAVWSERINSMEDQWWNEFEPFDRFDLEYGENDFCAEWEVNC